jgi:DNA gyrase subunit B
MTTGAASPPMHPIRWAARGRKLVMTMLHAGGKFGGGGYKVSGGLHGVGVSAVNALSDWLKLEIRRGGKVSTKSTPCWHPTTDLKQTGVTDRRGTKVTFHPDPTIFKNVLEFNFDQLARSCASSRTSTAALQIVIDRRAHRPEGRIQSSRAASRTYVADMNANKSPISEVVAFSARARGHHRRYRDAVERRLQRAADVLSPTRSRTATAAPT